MATKDTGQPANGISRRAFLTSAAVAAAAVGCGFDVAYNAEKALAYENDATNYKVTSTTCPYCSASCGQRVVTALTGANAGKVVDIYGDFESPMNSGGLCAKGAGSLQLVNNPRRIGAWAGTHPVPNTNVRRTHLRRCDASVHRRYRLQVASRRRRLGARSRWTPPWPRSHAELVDRSRRAWRRRQRTTARASRSSARSHMNNESNYMYRKLIANFGTSNVEHQARI